MHYWGNHFRQVGRCEMNEAAALLLHLLHLLVLLSPPPPPPSRPPQPPPPPPPSTLFKLALLVFGWGLAPDGSTTQSHFNVLLSLTFASDPPQFYSALEFYRFSFLLGCLFSVFSSFYKKHKNSCTGELWVFKAGGCLFSWCIWGHFGKTAFFSKA